MHTIYYSKQGVAIAVHSIALDILSSPCIYIMGGVNIFMPIMTLNYCIIWIYYKGLRHTCELNNIALLIDYSHELYTHLFMAWKM